MQVTATEREAYRVARGVLRALREAGYVFHVDGVTAVGRWYGREETDASAVRLTLADAFAVGEAVVRCRGFDVDGRPGSWVLLIPENGEEVVSDHGVNLEGIIDPALDRLLG